jgi:hypothetical protein
MKTPARNDSHRPLEGDKPVALSAFQTMNLAVAFLLELCVLAALVYWGFSSGGGLPTRLALGLGAPLVAAVVWGLLLAPRATVSLGEPWSGLLKAAVFLAASLALYAAGQATLAWVFLLAVVGYSGLKNSDSEAARNKIDYRA